MSGAVSVRTNSWHDSTMGGMQSPPLNTLTR
jgi:hypothetical protein